MVGASKAQETSHFYGVHGGKSKQIDAKPRNSIRSHPQFSLQIPHQLSVPYMRNNLEFISFTILFILVNLGLFLARVVTFWDFKNYDHTRNWWIIMARACGQGLNFTSMFILIVMLRHSITKLREMGISVILPLDRHIYFHKVTGRLIVIYSLVHTAAHMGNLCKLFWKSFFFSWPVLHIEFTQ